jgi:ribosomal protein S3AE
MTKLQKKKFFEIDLPLIGEKLEASGHVITDLNNKTIKIDLARKLKGKATDLIFNIKVEDNKAIGYPKKLVVLPSFISHIFHNGASYVEDSFISKTKNSEVLIKPFLITRKKVSRAIRNNLRKTAKEFILNYLKEKTYLESARAIIFNDLQREMYPKLKKIYPLILCEIRVFETKELSKADLELKQPLATENPMEEKAELTQAEEYEAEQKKKLEEQKAEPQEESIPKEKKPRKNKKE